MTELLARLTPIEKAAVMPHLLGNTSSIWLSLVLTSGGHPISARSVRRLRASLQEEGVKV